MRAFCAYILYLIWYLYFRYRHRGSVQNRSWNNEIWKVYMPTYFVLHATSRPSRHATTVTLTRPERVTLAAVSSRSVWALGARVAR
jgi:hypothetical protein